MFNHGAKGEGAASTFSEPDSMGTNLLRYALWRAHGELPIAALITGAENPSARDFAVREHFHAIHYGARNKTAAIEALCGAHRVSSERLVCIFDDVNDLGMAFGCGIRVLVQRNASPLLHDYVARQDLCDYITAHSPRAPCRARGLRAAARPARLVRSRRRVARRVGRRLRRYFAARQAVTTEFIDQSAND